MSTSPKPRPASRADDRSRAVRETTERKIYVLPTEQVERIKAYQSANGIASEVEAVRRLIDHALEMRDTLHDLLNKLRARYAEEKDLRILGRDVLASHSLVKTVHFNESDVTFEMVGDRKGRINNRGTTFVEGGGYDNWDVYPAPAPPQPRPKSGGDPGGFTSKATGGGRGWEAPKGGADLDDDIPF